ncbi:MAG: 3-keto-5-aminohexanoate cleavage protein [SAR324 cluster bacterium]|nr:3-keto-5-aminohexanoate cleavage protein [SAR324 cluster bacterium]
MKSSDKVIVTCALTGVLTDPNMHPVPVTPREMADAAEQAYNAGASIVHCHFRQQGPGMGRFPTWDPDVVAEICGAIRDRVPDMIINMSTGVMGDDISEPVACLQRVKPEMAAMNAGTLNYLKIRKDGTWAWPPLIFDNPVSKIEKFLKVMYDNNIVPECECFDTGIVRSIPMLEANGLLKSPVDVSLVMGVDSGMPAKPEWIPLLVNELNPGTTWQVIAIGRTEVWPVLRRAVELGGNARTGVEDTFYLPDGQKTSSNGQLIEALVKIIHETGREIATTQEARQIYGLK